MAYSNQDIIDAYNQTVGAGTMSEADFVSQAQSQYGISADQLSSARGDLLVSSAPSYAPAPAPAISTAAPAADRWSQGQYDQFRNWSSGKTLDQITSKASEIGVTADELGRAFGSFGGSGQQVQNLTGYGTSQFGGYTTSGDKLSDWKFDTSTGWSKIAPKPKNQFSSDSSMPSTGINLSQVQTMTPWEVSKNQTVANQLEQIIAADSPLMQQARMRALQTANQRGMLNSSMAVSAGESALYDAAMPIAQQDASTYADAGRFNADANNTFSRDNNAFVRDAFMADFNLAANEWAKKQDQVRELEKMDYTQRLTLERDAIQNGYTNARDAILNGYTIARDNNTNAFTLQRDAAQNTFTAGENDKDRTAAANRTAMGIQPDTSMARLATQINADKDTNALKVQQGAQETITNARVQLNKDLINIKGEAGLSTEVKDQMVSDAINSYNTIVNGHLANAGWSADSWSYKVTSAPAQSSQTATTTGTSSGGTQGSESA